MWMSSCVAISDASLTKCWSESKIAAFIFVGLTHSVLGELHNVVCKGSVSWNWSTSESSSQSSANHSQMVKGRLMRMF